jgi:hypothetical protein
MRCRCITACCALLFAALHFFTTRRAAHTPDSSDAGAWLEALVIGSVDRPQHLAVTLTALRSAGVRAHGFTERDVPLCVVCDDTHQWADVALYDSFDSDLKVSVWSGKPRAWWCAQARPTAALLSLSRRRASPHGADRASVKSAFVLVVDDDTYVNVPRLHALLLPLVASASTEPLYLGFAGHQFRDLPSNRQPPFCYGGAGYVLNDAAVRILSTQLPACHARKQGGRWCHYHSDWVIGQCLLSSPAHVACDWRLGDDLFVQNVSVLPGGLAACVRERVTCHGGLSANDLRRAYKMHLD